MTHNAGPTKLDWFLQRSLSYDVRVDDRGHATATVEVRLRNTFAGTPDNFYFHWKSGGFDLGVNQQMVSLYSAVPLQSLTVDGRPLTPDASTERGRHIADAFARPSQASRWRSATSSRGCFPGQAAGITS